MDLVFVTAFCPTEEQEKTLERCIDSVKNCGCHIALLSHSHIPIHIQKKCDYYFYDYNNEISEDYNLIGHLTFGFNDFLIQSRFFKKTFYGFAIYRMFSMVSQIAINFGYENIHHIEYDCELLDNNLIKENADHLMEYDSVIYTSNGNKDGFLFGSFKSFKVKSLPSKFINYDKNFIDEGMRNLEFTHLEYLTKNLFLESGNVLFKNEPSETRFKRGKNLDSRNLHHTLYFNPYDKTLNFFYKSNTDFISKIVIITNEKNLFEIKINPHHWHILQLGIFDEIRHVRIDNGEKIIYEKTFDAEFREIFKTKSYITYAKDN